jgi:hypothetical protein
MSRESGSPLLSQKITNATTQTAGPPQRRIRTVVGEASRERVASVAFTRKRLAARRLPQGHSWQNRRVPFEQYHEPPDELPEEVRTFARICVSLIEEAEAIDWYEQRLALEKDPAARAIMENAQQEEFKHFAMNLEFLARRNEKWRTVLKDVLFKEGDIVEHGEAAEAELDDG